LSRGKKNNQQLKLNGCIFITRDTVLVAASAARAVLQKSQPLQQHLSRRLVTANQQQPLNNV